MKTIFETKIVGCWLTFRVERETNEHTHTHIYSYQKKVTCHNLLRNIFSSSPNRKKQKQEHKKYITNTCIIVLFSNDESRLLFCIYPEILIICIQERVCMENPENKCNQIGMNHRMTFWQIKLNWARILHTFT